MDAVVPPTHRPAQNHTTNHTPHTTHHKACNNATSLAFFCANILMRERMTSMPRSSEAFSSSTADAGFGKGVWGLVVVWSYNDVGVGGVGTDGVLGTRRGPWRPSHSDPNAPTDNGKHMLQTQTALSKRTYPCSPPPAAAGPGT